MARRLAATVDTTPPRDWNQSKGPCCRDRQLRTGIDTADGSLVSFANQFNFTLHVAQANKKFRAIFRMDFHHSAGGHNAFLIITLSTIKQCRWLCLPARDRWWITRVATNVDFSTKRGKTKIFITDRGKNVVFGDFYGKTVDIWNRSQGKKKVCFQRFFGNFSLYLATWMKSTFWAEKCGWWFFFSVATLMVMRWDSREQRIHIFFVLWCHDPPSSVLLLRLSINYRCERMMAPNCLGSESKAH